MSNTKVSVRRARGIDAPYAYNVVVTPAGFGSVSSFTVHTDARGRGLWKDGRQIEGTSQFSIGRNAAAAYRRYFAKW